MSVMMKLWGAFNSPPKDISRGTALPISLDHVDQDGGYCYITVSPRGDAQSIGVAVSVDKVTIWLVPERGVNWCSGSKHLITFSLDEAGNLQQTKGTACDLDAAKLNWPAATIRAAQRILGIRPYAIAALDEEEDIDPAVIRESV